MDADNQDDLYENYWLPIEKALKRGKDYSNLNLFFYNYVVYKAVAPVNNSRLYENFVKQFKLNRRILFNELKNLRRYIFSIKDNNMTIYEIQTKNFLNEILNDDLADKILKTIVIELLLYFENVDIKNKYYD